MTPESQTAYSLLLFFALVALQQWTYRRHPVAVQNREAARQAEQSEVRG